MFLAHATRLKVRAWQLDFVGAFLQAKMCTRMLVTIPNIYGQKPVRLQMSMYGTTLCIKYWYMDLLDYLKEKEFKEGGCVKCFFVKKFPDDSKLYILNYVDDMLYWGTNSTKVMEFEEQLRKHFNLESLGQAHWYLGTRIDQLVNADLELDHGQYCLSIVKKYLNTRLCQK
jgi:hypothetical protein